MALVKRCDVTRMEITDFDAGEGPMVCSTPDGHRIRIEVLPNEKTGQLPHLRAEAVKRMIEHNELVPEKPNDPDVKALPVRDRA